MLNSSIRPIYRILPDATTPGQSRSGSDGNEGVLDCYCITVALKVLINVSMFFFHWMLKKYFYRLT